MSKKDRAPHVSKGDSRKLQAIVQARAANPRGKTKMPWKGPGMKDTKGAKPK